MIYNATGDPAATQSNDEAGWRHLARINTRLNSEFRIGRLLEMVMDAAIKQDNGQDVRTEASMIKVFATEMVTEIADHAMQAFGAMGMTKELPLQQMANEVRLMRIYDGPTEIHNWVVARELLRKTLRLKRFHPFSRRSFPGLARFFGA